MPTTRRLTMGQAIVEFLIAQYTSLDGEEQPFFGGVSTIFGHGNVAGIGQALLQAKDRLPCYFPRNEQAMVHTAVGFAKMANRRRTLACTSSIGPGATNMLTGAALATINRLPVLLLPGDIFATRGPAPVLQQLESPGSQDVSVNDCFRPVSRYWDRINRPEQLITALPEALRILTSPAETGAVTLCLPQDVQAEAFDYPEALFRKRVWTIARPRPDADLLRQAAAWLRSARSPVIVAGGGAIYSEATAALAGLRGGHRHSGGRDDGRQGRAPVRSSAGAGRGRGHRRRRRQPHRARGGPRHRRRLAAERLHHRLEDGLSAPGRPVRQRQHHRVRCGQAPGAGARRRRAGDARRMAAADAGLADAGRVSGAGRSRAARLGRRSRSRLRGHRQAGDEPGGGGRHSQRLHRPPRRDRQRRRQPARRSPQTVARARPEAVPPGIRLFLHGLRDRGRRSGSSWRRPTARSTSWSATGRT